MYTCIYIYIYMRVYIHIYIYIYIHTCWVLKVFLLLDPICMNVSQTWTPMMTGTILFISWEPRNIHTRPLRLPETQVVRFK